MSAAEAMSETKPGREQRAYEWQAGPKRHAEERRCEAALSRCATADQLHDGGQKPERGKVNPFASRVKGVLLCEACRRKCLRLNLEPSELTHLPEVLPAHGPKRTGFHLPNLRPVRKSRGLSMREVAIEAGCVESTVAAVECGRHRPSLDLINRLAFAVRASVKDLKGEDAA